METSCGFSDSWFLIEIRTASDYEIKSAAKAQIKCTGLVSIHQNFLFAEQFESEHQIGIVG
jgi:hypothetical protein